jgi:hypothetical protein
LTGKPIRSGESEDPRSGSLFQTLFHLTTGQAKELKEDIELVPVRSSRGAKVLFTKKESMAELINLRISSS